MITDYDDDTHFCLKCNATILGLDNYVTHRKTGCGKNIQGPPKSPLPSQLLPQDETFPLIADDFFSSLELQSSAKKATTQSTGGKGISGVLTRSKTTAVIQATNVNKEAPLQEIATITAVKTVDNPKKEEHPPINVFESEDDSEEYEYEDESDEEDEAPPRSSGGKWKPSSSPIQWSNNDNRGWNTPSPTYTGGKWNPSLMKQHSSPPHQGKGKWKPTSPKGDYSEIPPPTNTKGKWKPINPHEREEERHQEYPPPESTKGKWKPSFEEIDRKTQESDKWERNKAPSPLNTKGKWIENKISRDRMPKNLKYKHQIEESPFRKSGGTIQYWCGPCNRRLASKIVYERHLKSELHFKRKLHEREFDDTIEPTNTSKESRRIIKKIPTQISSTITNDKKRRARKKLYVKCDVCQSKVNLNLMGKHLISNYHCRKGDMSHPEAQRMILENIHDIILQSPFQCSCCRFYCNTQTEFLAHWKSSLHLTSIAKISGYFLCTFCKFETFENDVMFSHLISNQHSEVLSVINRSVPIVIKKIDPVVCPTCGDHFLLNVQLKGHCRLRNHEYPKDQEEYFCKKCNKIFKSSVSFNRHQRGKHKIDVYGCTVCSKSFENISEAVAHRASSEHRYNLQSSKNKVGQICTKSCEYCSQNFNNLLDFKNHIKKKHPEYGPRCPHCGKTFAIYQELSVHVRNKACSFDNDDQKSKHSCPECPFTSNSTSEILFHKVLHNEPLLIYPESSEGHSSSQRPVPQYKCPVCDKFFPKSSLRCHIRIHTKETPYVCSICNTGFVRKSSWALHVKSQHVSGTKKKKKKNEVATGDRPFLCSTCGANFKRKFVLQQHMKTHGEKQCKCPKVGCVYTCRNLAELNQHFVTHSDVKSFSCDLCEYKGKTKQQLLRHQTIHTKERKFSCPHCPFKARISGHLKRHIRTHTSSKPFGCPHCSYRCNNLENLRKHVLSTNKHPGKCIYECEFCDSSKEEQLKTNFAKELKVHLVTKHQNVFTSATAASTYISGICDRTEKDGSSRAATTNMDIEDNESTIQSENEEDETIPQMKTFEDPVVASSTSTVLLPFSNQENKGQEELFPLFIVAKDEIVAVDSTPDTWSMIGSYDVESGVLIPFHADGETLFHEF